MSICVLYLYSLFYTSYEIAEPFYFSDIFLYILYFVLILLWYKSKQTLSFSHDFAPHHREDYLNSLKNFNAFHYCMYFNLLQVTTHQSSLNMRDDFKIFSRPGNEFNSSVHNNIVDNLPNKVHNLTSSHL